MRRTKIWSFVCNDLAFIIPWDGSCFLPCILWNQPQRRQLSVEIYPYILRGWCGADEHKASRWNHLYGRPVRRMLDTHTVDCRLCGVIYYETCKHKLFPHLQDSPGRVRHTLHKHLAGASGGGEIAAYEDSARSLCWESFVVVSGSLPERWPRLCKVCLAHPGRPVYEIDKQKMMNESPPFVKYHISRTSIYWGRTGNSVATPGCNPVQFGIK